MAFVQKAVARLNEPDKLTSLLKELGRKHHGYGAKAKYVDVSAFLLTKHINKITINRVVGLHYPKRIYITNIPNRMNYSFI